MNIEFNVKPALLTVLTESPIAVLNFQFIEKTITFS